MILNPKLFDESMDNRYEWHGAPPDGMDIEGAPKKGEQAKEALKQLEELEKNLK